MDIYIYIKLWVCIDSTNQKEYFLQNDNSLKKQIFPLIFQFWCNVIKKEKKIFRIMEIKNKNAWFPSNHYNTIISVEIKKLNFRIIKVKYIIIRTINNLRRNEQIVGNDHFVRNNHPRNEIKKKKKIHFQIPYIIPLLQKQIPRTFESLFPTILHDPRQG